MANLRGFWTLFSREVNRFIKVINQALVAPVISSLLYIIVFGLFIGSQIEGIQGVSYLQFLIPGLVMMGVIVQSYSNTSSSILLSKFYNNHTEMLTAPLSYLEMVLALTLGGVVRGVVVGIVILLVSFLFVPLAVANIFVFLYFIFFVSLIFSSIGVMMGMWAEKFDHIATFSNFILTPLTYLGGVFYSITLLPGFLAAISTFNPILYMVNGMRYGMLGLTDVNIAFAMIMVFALGVFFLLYNVRLFKIGYKIKT